MKKKHVFAVVKGAHELSLEAIVVISEANRRNAIPADIKETRLISLYLWIFSQFNLQK